MLISLSETDQVKLRPFRYIKIVSNAAVNPILLSGVQATVLVNLNPTAELDASIVVDSPDPVLQPLTGHIYPGDTFTIAGDVTVYTVATALYFESVFQVDFTPGLVQEAAVNAEVTFDQIAIRGETSDRQIVVVAK